jgi:hypothetical protein
LGDEISDAAVGLGLFTTILFGVVPGFLPTLALTLFAGVILLIPVLVVGVVVGVPLLVLRLVRFTKRDGHSVPLHDTDRLALPVRQSRSGAAA